MSKSVKRRIMAASASRRRGRRRSAWDRKPPHVDEAGRRARAAREYAATVEKLEACPAAKAYMWGLADAEAKAGRRFSFRWVCEQARAKSFAAGDADFSFNNNVIPAIARIYLEERPSAREFVELKPSKFDLLGSL